jgi:hypothetical protein
MLRVMPLTGDLYWRKRFPEGEVRLLLADDDDADTVANCDGFVSLGHGLHSFTAMTLEELRRVMERHESTGEGGRGSWLHIPDLVIVRSGGAMNIAEAAYNLASELPTAE